MPRLEYAGAILGIESDGSVVVGDGLVELALRSPDAAPVSVRRRILGIEPDRLVEIGDGLVVLPLRSQAAPRLLYAVTSLGSIRMASS